MPKPVVGASVKDFGVGAGHSRCGQPAHRRDELRGIDPVVARVLDRVLNPVHAVGHVAEVAGLLAVGEIAELVQCRFRVLGVGCFPILLGVVGFFGVAGQERHQLTRIGLLGDLAVPHQAGEVDDVLLRDHVIGADILTLVLGDIDEHLCVVGVVDHHVRGQTLGAVLQGIGAFDVQERQRPGRGLLLDPPLLAGLALQCRRLHRQIRGVGVRAQPTDVGELAPERPLAPLAAAVPVGDGVSGVALVEATEAGTLEDQHVVGAVVADHRGHDPGRGDVLDRDMALALEAHRLLADILPGGGADAAIGLNQIHVLGEPGVQPLVHDLADPVDVGIRVVAELGDRIVVVVDRRGQVDVPVAQTGGTVRAVLDQIAPPPVGASGVKVVDRVLGTVGQTTGGGTGTGATGGTGQCGTGLATGEHLTGGTQGRKDQRQDRLVAAAVLDQVSPSGTGAERVDDLTGLVVQVIDGLVDGMARARAEGHLFDLRVERKGIEDFSHEGVVDHQVVGRAPGEVVGAGAGAVVLVALVFEGDRIRGVQTLVSVDVVDRLQGRRAVVAREATGIVLGVGVVGQLGRIVGVQGCPGQATVVGGLVAEAVVVVVGSHPVAVEVAARVGVLGNVVVRRRPERLAGQRVAEVVALPVGGIEINAAGRLVAAQFSLVEPDLETVASNFVLGAASHGFLGDDPARAVSGVNRCHWVVLLEGLLPLRAGQAVIYRG